MNFENIVLNLCKLALILGFFTLIGICMYFQHIEQVERIKVHQNVPELKK